MFESEQSYCKMPSDRKIGYGWALGLKTIKETYFIFNYES